MLETNLSIKNMKIISNHITSLVLLSVIVISCDGISDPAYEILNEPYITLDVGDLRQYYIVQRDLFVNWEIIERIDTIKDFGIYKVIETYYFPIGTLEGTFYYFINENFLWEIVPDTSAEKPDLNKAIKIAQVHPQNGLVFESGQLYPDFSSVNISVNFIDSIKLPSGTYYHVAVYSRLNKEFSDDFISYYSKFWGHIASKITTPDELIEIKSVYLKVKNKEIGNYKDLIYHKILTGKNEGSITKKTGAMHDCIQKFPSIFSLIYNNLQPKK